MPAATKTKSGTKIVLDFDYEKDTPGTIRFKERQEDSSIRPTVGSIYITKKAITEAGLKGKHLVVTIEDGG